MQYPAGGDRQTLHPAEEFATEGFNIRDILGLLRRQAKLIIATFLVVVIVAAVGALSLTPIYSSSTLVLVDPSRKNLLDPNVPGTTSAQDSGRVDSEVEIIRSDGILMKVIQDANLVTDPEFGVKLGLRDRVAALLRIGDAQLPTGEEALGNVLTRLKSAVSVQRRGMTYLIAVTVRSESPEKAAMLANAIATTYITEQVQAKIDNSLASRDIIEQQITQAQQSLVQAERAYNDYISTNMDDIIRLTGRTDLRDIQAEIDNLEEMQSDVSGRAQTLRSGLDGGDMGVLLAELQSEAAQALEEERNRLLAQLQGAEQGSQTAVNLQQELASIEQSLVETAREELTTLQQSLSETDAAASAARQQRGSALFSGNLPPDIAAELYGLRQVSVNATSKYQALLSRMQDLETESSLQVADSRVVSAALAPIQPSFPNLPLILALSGMVAVGIGVALAFLFENYIGGFNSPEQLRAVTGQKLSTVLPLQHHEPDMASVADTLVTSPLSRYSEGVRRLRAMLDISLRKQEASAGKGETKGRVIMVSSALPGEGKTTVALSLARTYALAGQRVIILDCDLRKPSIHRHLNVDSSSGLVDVLSGEVPGKDLFKILINDPKSPLIAIVGTRRADLPTDQLVASRSFGQIIASARQRFDYIIIDSPPIEPVVDGLYLAQHADAIAFVVRWATTPQRAVVSALERLGTTMKPGTDILIGLNQQEGRSMAYSGSYSGSYYTD